MKSVLVTGGAGYIGSHVCKALAKADYLPITYDNLVNGHRESVRWGPFEHGDILDRTGLDRVFSLHKPEAVIHLAAFAYVGESVADPGKYYRDNVAGSLTLLEAMRDHGTPSLVYSSSCAVYGEPAENPITETAPCQPVNPYGMSKFVTERMIGDFAAATGLKWIALRYFNAAGADPDGETGEDHDPETRIIPLAIAASLGQSTPFDVLGTDYETHDGSCIRDYIHVSDLADAHVAALQALERGLKPQSINIGTGNGVSVLEVVASVGRCTGQTVPVQMAPRRNGDPAILVADASKARDLLGWMPRHPSIDDIVSTALAWHKKKSP